MLAEALMQSDGWQSGLTTAQVVFAMMPLRHSSTIQRLETVLANIDKQMADNKKDNDLLLKFQKQTVRFV